MASVFEYGTDIFKTDNYRIFFYVLLIVHLNIILVINQPNAQILVL